MTQEEKSILLKDLCSRLPYGVMIEGLDYPEVMTIKHFAIISVMPAEPYKPYLRPMSSMTEEERDRLRSLDGFIQCDMLYNIVEGDFEVFDYLNSIHVSYRTFNGKDMFELGLALEAPKDMYNLKEK